MASLACAMLSSKSMRGRFARLLGAACSSTAVCRADASPTAASLIRTSASSIAHWARKQRVTRLGLKSRSAREQTHVVWPKQLRLLSSCWLHSSVTPIEATSQCACVLLIYSLTFVFRHHASLIDTYQQILVSPSSEPAWTQHPISIQIPAPMHCAIDVCIGGTSYSTLVLFVQITVGSLGLGCFSHLSA